MADQTETQQAPPAEQHTNEPVEPKAAADALQVKIGSHLFTLVMFAVLVFVVVGTCVPWFRYLDNSGNETRIGLWKIKAWTAGTESTTLIRDVPCKDLRQRFRAAESFAIISIFGALVSVIAGFFGLRPVGLAFSLWTFASTLITWGTGFNMYYKTFCGDNLFDDHFQIYAGAALFVGAFVLSFVAFVLLVKDPVAPVGEGASTAGAHIFTLLFLIAFVFTVVGTAVDQFQYVDASGEVLITLWSVEQNPFGSTGSQRWYVRDLSSCKSLVDMQKAAESFAIISIATTLAGFISGVALLHGNKNYRGFAFYIGVIAVAATVTVWGIEASVYHRSWLCAPFGTLHLAEQKYTYGAGFVLFVAAFVAAVLAVVALSVGVVASRLFRLKSTVSPIKIVPNLFLFFVGISVIFCVVGCFEDVVRKEATAGNTARQITWWRVYSWDLTSHSNERVSSVLTDCKGRFRAGEAFTVMSCVFTAFAFILGYRQLFHCGSRVAAGQAGLVASVFQLVTWAMGVAIYHNTVCNGFNFSHDDYAIGAGLGLYIAAWCLTTVSSVLNLAIAE